MLFTYRCMCGQLKTVIFGKGPCESCEGNAIFRIEGNLKIDPQADGQVRIPVGAYEVTVDALRNTDIDLLASTVNMPIHEFESRIREWATGVGLPYGVLAQER